MEYKNSYIFLKRKKEEKEVKKDKKDNTIVISLSPSFKELLKETFKNISFDEKEDDFDIINSGTFKIKNNNENVDVLFKYHNVWSNYYLDIIVKSRKKQDAINILEVVNASLSTTLKEEQKLQKFLSKNQDLTKLSDSEIREAFKLCSNKTDWERFFGDKNFDDNFQQILNDIRNFRNNIAHCKFISKEQYENCIDILKKTTKSLDVAIKITEKKDFINKNLELQHESFERLAKTMRETVLNIYKPLMENIDAITQPMRNLSEKLNEIVKPITYMIPNIPNIVLPEIELPKFNIPNYFDLMNVEENDVEEKDNNE